MSNYPFKHKFSTLQYGACEYVANESNGCSLSDSVHHLLEENQRYLSQLTSLLQDTTQEMEHSVVVREGERK